MKGIPENMQTKADWENALAYAIENEPAKVKLKSMMMGLLESRTSKVLKKGVKKPPEEQTSDDFESIDDQASPFNLSGLSQTEIEKMISKL